jgi:hypothetical protein
MSKRGISMKKQITDVLLVTGLFIFLALTLPVSRSALGSADTQSSGGMVRASRAAVVVELFTSEGCSSCPPADKLLSWLGERQPLEGAEIIPLSEHVDYWNRLGWADPFSSSVFSERQRAYSDSLKSEAYTPQMVVDGKVEFVGSDRNQALKAISNELHAARCTVRIEPISPASSSRQNLASFSVQVEKLPPLDTNIKGFVFLAVTENNLQSSVSSGENSGRLLAHTAVVRELKMIGKLDTRPDTAFTAQPTVEISNGWKRKDLRAVVFVQLQDSRRILGAADTPFPSL